MGNRRHRHIPPQTPLPRIHPREPDMFAAELNEDTSIDLHNLPIDEAIRSLEDFLDHACLQGMPAIKIIHGRGTQKLRNAVHAYLRKQTTYVETFRDATTLPQQGGVTIAALYDFRRRH